MALSAYQRAGQTTHISVSDGKANSSPQSLLLNGSTASEFNRGANTQLKAAVLTDSFNFSNGGEISCELFTPETGNRRDGDIQAGFVFRYQDINNFYYGVFNQLNADSNDEAISSVGKIESGVVGVIAESEGAVNLANSSWNSITASGFENSNGDFVVRLSSGNQVYEIADDNPSFSSGGAHGFVQGGDSNNGDFTNLSDLLPTAATKAFIDDVTHNY